MLNVAVTSRPSKLFKSKRFWRVSPGEADEDSIVRNRMVNRI